VERDASTTLQDSRASGAADSPAPGVVLLFHRSRPTLTAFAPRGASWTLGRGDEADILVDDARLSRVHTRIEWDGEQFTVTDLGSRNGTFVDGKPVKRPVRGGRVMRGGTSLFLLVDDVRPWLHATIAVEDGLVLGPRFAASWHEIAALAGTSATLHIHGESGTGKELAARLYHRAGPAREGPWVAVNCAAIPANLAESLLFGVRKGAFTGADRETEGYVLAADRGVLFLDEVSDLPLDVQAKLLRVLESREVLALGATRPRAVSLRVCSAAQRDLRVLAAAGAFRTDLLFRIASPTVALPPLRERIEAIPTLAELLVRRVAPEAKLHPLLVEKLLCRPWPGNVRELLAEVSRAAQRAHAAGRAVVSAEDLSPAAGCALGPAGAGAPSKTPRTARELADDEILHALREHGGNLTAAARGLGLHRNQLRRWVNQRGIDIRALISGTR